VSAFMKKELFEVLSFDEWISCVSGYMHHHKYTRRHCFVRFYHRKRSHDIVDVKDFVCNQTIWFAFRTSELSSRRSIVHITDLIVNFSSLVFIVG
jgi:hypothetical protein